MGLIVEVLSTVSLRCLPACAVAVRVCAPHVRWCLAVKLVPLLLL